MRLSGFRILNFKSFADSEYQTLTPGINVITGKNNSGKSAILQALSGRIVGHPHRSLTSMPSFGDPPPQSAVDLSIVISKSELMPVINDHNFVVNVPDSKTMLAKRAGFAAQQTHEYEKLANVMFERDEFELHARLSADGNWSPLASPCFGDENPTWKDTQGRSLTMSLLFRNGRFEYQGANWTADRETLSRQVVPHFLSRIYRFSAERFNIGAHSFGSASELLPNASNLPEVLNTLQGGNPERWKEYNRLVSIVFPQIYLISVRPKMVERGVSELEVITWPLSPSSQRSDLAIPLAESGTGVGQVLAMLYVILNNDIPRVLLIDEPQSFLHPGAVRKLIDIFGMYPKHQYVLTTHSPTVISACDTTSVIMCTSQEGTSKCTSLNAYDQESAQVVLSEIGARLSDVFGADSILWVEGPTEEICFPEILASLSKERLLGTVILGVRRTGDLEGKDADRIFEIYASISKANYLVPPALAFVLDSEVRSEEKKRELSVKSGGRLHFLERRTYENYIMSPPAIAATINQFDTNRQTATTADEVDAILQQLKEEKSFYSPGACQPECWEQKINAPMVLKRIFSEVTENREQFDKVKHGPVITRWVLQNEPERLSAIKAQLELILTPDRGSGLEIRGQTK